MFVLGFGLKCVVLVGIGDEAQVLELRPALPVEPVEARHRDAAGLDALGGKPAAFHRHQAEVAVRDVVAAV